MKKTYIMPSMKMVESETEELMQASQTGGVSSENGIGYGGVDQGENEPNTRPQQTVWSYDDDAE